MVPGWLKRQRHGSSTGKAATTAVFVAPQPPAIHLQCKGGAHKTAKSTTTQEFLDNVRCIIREWQGRGERDPQGPLLMFDNIQIQDAADLSSIGLSINNRLFLPAYSPDFNRSVEHTVGYVKDEVQGRVYGWMRQHATAPSDVQLAAWVLEAFESRSQQAVAFDMQGLKLLFEVLTHDKDVKFRDSDGHWHVGSGGAWTQKTYSW